jgi:DNA-binding NarL/FixJ family response regulator
MEVERRRVHLTTRQLEILDLIANGKTDKDIAARLRVSRRTVGAHLQRMYQANGFHTRAEAVAAWLQTRATADPPIGHVGHLTASHLPD